MSIENINKTSVIADGYPQEASDRKKFQNTKKVNIDVLKMRVFKEQKRERFQNRVFLVMFCVSIAILGYIVV